MNIAPRIEFLEDKKLVGVSLSMSLIENRTIDLWRSFMVRNKEIKNKANSEYISLQVYPKDYYQNFSPANKFVKWALVEVTDAHVVPDGMEVFVLSKGKYAVFDYKGLPNDARIFTYIFQEWLPNSKYQLANRPHFEVLGDKYKNNDPNSEEQIWIPIQ
ncbi:GyrI-like domain-containing protein [Maribacter thermophilus]|uniref:GyrI-like domain-containing protein n=1 Tax=Maribacter thermophilus TaxID=1197874 RepID=UPI000B1106AF|nr:GyrI-like domain-containing protein [Maribacter thermophilus]